MDEFPTAAASRRRPGRLAGGRVLDLPGWLYRRAADAYVGDFRSINLKLRYLCGIALVGYTLYYFVWGVWFVQPYENWPLRVAGTLVCAAFLIWDRVSRTHGKGYQLFSYMLLIFCVPFFFTFMTIKNEFNAVWLASSIAAVLYVALVVDWLNLVIIYTVGAVAAMVVHSLDPGTGQAVSFETFLWTVPIFMFALGGGVAFKHAEERSKKDDRMGAMALANSIAHEMRTPLLSVKADMDSVRRRLPALLEAHRWARQHGYGAGRLTAQQEQLLMATPERAGEQVDYANAIITNLLVNVQEERIGSDTFQTWSMAQVVRQALERYPFKGDQRSRVVSRLDRDFRFFGDDMLMVHVVFNLMKNALRALDEADRGRIEIWLEPGEEANRLHFRDTGTGIPRDALPYLFDRFYSRSRMGAGIGLAFCKRVVESFDGTIDCRSAYGKYTEFIIFLPHKANG